MTSVHYSSDRISWDTPPDLFERLDRVFCFTLDPCATPHNALCQVYFTPEQNGLAHDWSGHRVFMNPPYGREISKWVEKAYSESLSGAIVVCLLPARTDTAWWHDFVMKGQVVFIRGRLRFSGSAKDAPFPSAIVVFGKASILCRGLAEYINGPMSPADPEPTPVASVPKPSTLLSQDNNVHELAHKLNCKVHEYWARRFRGQILDPWDR